MPDDTHMDLRPRVAALKQMLVARTAERDGGLQQESATRFTPPPSPPPSRGRTPHCSRRLFGPWWKLREYRSPASGGGRVGA